MAAPRAPAVLALLLLGLAGLAAAQEVEVKHWFPDNLATNEFFPGKTVTCVLGVRNAGIAPVNVTLLTAQLASPIEATRNIFNFTSKFLNHQVLAPGAEASLDYELAFPRQLPTQQFVLKMTLVVAVRDSSSGRDGWLPNLFFNETITMVEGKTWVDTELLGLLVIFLGVLGLGVYGAAEVAKSKGWISKKSRKFVAKPTGPTDNAEWLRGTSYEAAARRKSAARG